MKDITTLGFGNGAITERDWEILIDYVHTHRVRTVLEIGAGFSTTLLARAGLLVTTFETNVRLIESLRNLFPQVRFVKYEYPEFPDDVGSYDLAFVDGPGQGNDDGRAASMRFVLPRARAIFVHDSRRAAEKASLEAVFPDKYWQKTCNHRSSLMLLCAAGAGV